MCCTEKYTIFYSPLSCDRAQSVYSRPNRVVYVASRTVERDAAVAGPRAILSLMGKFGTMEGKFDKIGPELKRDRCVVLMHISL